MSGLGKIADLERDIARKKRELAELRRTHQREPVHNYLLRDLDGNDRRLRQLFGRHRDLIIVHNTGSQLPYCTMWADGFDGLMPYIRQRSSFVVVSHDDPETQREFAREQDWTFEMLSDPDGDFTEAMGFYKDGRREPGVSTFAISDEGRLERVAHRRFTPRDDFCPVWHFFDLLAGGIGGWRPRGGEEPK
jgi:predicted dithiol-disulfide oxidoreductase (DUF899 family)